MAPHGISTHKSIKVAYEEERGLGDEVHVLVVVVEDHGRGKTVSRHEKARVVELTATQPFVPQSIAHDVLGQILYNKKMMKQGRKEEKGETALQRR